MQGSRRRLAVLFAVLPLAVQGQGVAPIVPGAGTILQQVQPVTPVAPSSTGTGLTIERESGVKPEPGVAFKVRSIRISGNTQFDESVLHGLVASEEGKDLTLAQLDELAERITDYYRRHGYPLARAIIPAQEIRAGEVRLEVIEARYGRINLDNRSRVNDALLRATLSPLQSGQTIQQADLDRALLLLQDIPGVGTNATLKPGESTGTSDLEVEAAPGAGASGNAALDNFGNRFTGRARIGATLNLIDPLRHGDILSLNVLSSGSGMKYARVGYEALLNGLGTRVGGSYSALKYKLGGSLASLQGHGTAQVESLWAKHPFLRSQTLNLYGQLQYDRTKLRDHIDLVQLRTDRHLDGWTASLTGDVRDGFLAGGVSTWSLSATSGHLGFDDDIAQAVDAATARIQGGFLKWNLSLARLQALGPSSAVYLLFSGQAANDNLDPSKKMVAGGPYSVRAYDVATLLGDRGYSVTAEFRQDLGSDGIGQWQAVAFIDSAQVTVNRRVWVAGTNSATLSGAGVGLNWTGPEQWTAKAHVAKPMGSIPVLVTGKTSTRAWVEISKGF